MGDPEWPGQGVLSTATPLSQGDDKNGLCAKPPRCEMSVEEQETANRIQWPVTLASAATDCGLDEP